MVNPPPGHPWPRGQGERKFREFIRWLKGQPGAYDKKDRQTIKPARERSDLLTLEQIVAELDERFKELNTQSRGGKPSRFDLWKSELSLPAPSVRRLAHLDLENAHEKVKIGPAGFYFDGILWEPKTVEGKNSKIYVDRMNATASEEEVDFWAVRLDTGWIAEVCLRDAWVEAILRGSEPYDIGQHVEAQRGSIKSLSQQARQMKEHGENVLQRLVGGIPRRISSTGEYVLPSEVSTQRDNEDASKPTAPASASADGHAGPPVTEQTQTSSSVKRTPSKRQNRAPDKFKSEATPPQQPQDSSTEEDVFAGLPNLDETIRRIRETSSEERGT
jgi:hypothetical protein